MFPNDNQYPNGAYPTPPDYATKAWVISQGYQNSAQVSAIVAAALTGYATQSWVTTQLSSYVPNSRTLTINGVTYDLSANRTWTISAGATAWGTITGTLSAQTDLQSALDAKVDENSPITGATKTKITYDSKGLVTSGADATTADIADSLNKRYVTDAQLTIIGNTSGTNTGDQFTATTASRLLGRGSAGAGAAEEITLGTGLSMSGTTLNVTISDTGITQLTGDVTAGPGNGSQAATLASIITAGGPIGSSSVVPIITYDAKGRLTSVSNATITPAAIGAPSGSGTSTGSNTGDQTITLTGDVTGSGTGSFAATIANNAVTYAKMQDVSAASKLIGRGDSGSGDPQEITIGSGLAMTGTTLSATGGGGFDPNKTLAYINSQ